jgi:hypothetical protein
LIKDTLGERNEFLGFGGAVVCIRDGTTGVGRNWSGFGGVNEDENKIEGEDTDTAGSGDEDEIEN